MRLACCFSAVFTASGPFGDLERIVRPRPDALGASLPSPPFSDRSQIKSLVSVIVRVGYAWTDRPGGVTTHTLAVQIRDPAVGPLWRARCARLGRAEDVSSAPLPTLHPVYSRLDA
jgi:hypothetical protein